MNSIEMDLVELVEMSEQPLYGGCDYLGMTSLNAYLEMVQELIERDALQLWLTNSRQGVREQLPALPEGLLEEYEAVPDLDPSYDPFGLTLRLGSAVEKREPEWEVDLDRDAGRYVMTALPDVVPEAYERMARLFAPTTFVESTRRLEGERLRIEGTLGPHQP